VLLAGFNPVTETPPGPGETSPETAKARMINISMIDSTVSILPEILMPRNPMAPATSSMATVVISQGKLMP